MKYKLNPDQSMIKKLNDLNPTDRSHYIASLSKQAIKNVVSYVHNSTKWTHSILGDHTHIWFNDSLQSEVQVDLRDNHFSYIKTITVSPEDVFSADDLESMGFNTIGAWKR